MTDIIEQLRLKEYNFDKYKTIVNHDNRHITIEEETTDDGDRNIPITMSITMRWNNWDGEKEFKFLDLNDFLISGVYNGSTEQRVQEIKPEKGTFTKFVKEFLKNRKVFYVMAPTQYWDKVFNKIKVERDIGHYNVVGGGGRKKRTKKRRKSRRRKRTRKRRKSRRRKRTRKRRKKRRKI